MYNGQKVAVTIPAYNVADRIERVIDGIPDFVDLVVAVDDCSRDTTRSVLYGLQSTRLVVLSHPQNRGVGAAIATGYREAIQRSADVIAVMAGDGQMDPADLTAVIDPVIDQRADYAKGNRFAHPEIWQTMPPSRLVGNLLFSGLTKLTSGYPDLVDSQCGFTAISSRVLRAIDCQFYSRYGYPNDLLARLKIVGARVVDVPVRPIYDGQHSGIRPWTVIYPILFVTLRSYWRRWSATLG